MIRRTFFKNNALLFRIMTFMCVLILIVSSMPLFCCMVAAEEKNTTEGTNVNNEYPVGVSYFEQYSFLKASEKLNEEIKVYGEYYSNLESTSAVTAEVNDKSGIVLNHENSWCEWEIEAESTGVGFLKLEYMPLDEQGGDIIVSVTIDGKSPFSEAKNCVLPRIWYPDFSVSEEQRPFEKDSSGNEIRPDQLQAEDWNVKTLENPQGLYDEPYLFYLTEGKHTVRIAVTDAEIAIGELTFYDESYISYDEYYSLHSSQIVEGDKVIYKQAELFSEVSSSSIYATYDKTNAATIPNDPQYIMMNIVGGSNWSTQGEEISWRVDVPEKGMYRLAFRARQNINSGLNSYRTLKINGEVPFEEAKNLSFEYNQEWTMYTFGGDTALLLYLEPGDVLTLSCNTGETAKVLRNLKNILSTLNTLYRQIITITSVSPDIYQDYKLEDKLPTLSDELLKVYQQLEQTHADMCDILGTKGSLASSIKTVSSTIKRFSEKTYDIPDDLSLFKSNIETIGSLLTSLSSQPLEIDYIAFIMSEAELPEADCSFSKKLLFTLKQFIFSFTKDYNNIGDNSGYEKSINVWVSTGRDQAQIIERLISSDFTLKNNIGVSLSLVDTGTTLMRASLAGKGPDVALMIASGTPVELAARGALVNLDKYLTDDIYDDFHESAWVPFRYNGSIYAMPESQVFHVMFYRTDIFEQLDINVPDTWEEFYNVMEIIQSNNLAIGVPEIDSANMGVSASINIFSALLMQKGCLSFYEEDLSRTKFDTEEAYQAFSEWAELYTDYGLEREISFYNRFRTGEVPLAIRPYSEYVQIKQAAPEIDGLWNIAMLPGTPQENGEVTRSQPSVVTGCIILKAAETRGVADESAEFLKWWVSADIQSTYATDIEITMGTAGRYFSANLSAFKGTDWSAYEYGVLSEQLAHIVNQPTVIGSYAVNRDLTSALREVIDGTNRPRRALMLYNTDINEEIGRKRKEFELE